MGGFFCVWFLFTDCVFVVMHGACWSFVFCFSLCLRSCYGRGLGCCLCGFFFGFVLLYDWGFVSVCCMVFVYFFLGLVVFVGGF